MSATYAHNTPLSVEVVEGEVVIRSLDGPVGVSLTPEAAKETAKQLAVAADQASQTASMCD